MVGWFRDSPVTCDDSLWERIYLPLFFFREIPAPLYFGGLWFRHFLEGEV